MNLRTYVLQLALLVVGLSTTILIVGCGGMNAASYNAQGMEQFAKHDCASDTSFKRAADMEFEKTGDWYPIYMMNLALSRVYCDNAGEAIKAFQTVDQFVVKKSERSDVNKAVDFFKSSNKQLYELTDREETLLHYYMGFANYQAGNYEDALVELKKVDYIAEGTYSALPLSALMRGLVYLRLGQKDNALVAFRRMIEANPKSTLGYKLAILNETNKSNREFFKKAMRDSTGIEFTDPPRGTNPTLVIIDLGWKIELPKESIRFSVDERETHAAFVDVVDPDFDFGKFAGKFLANAASYAGRAVAKQALKSSIPFFGGIVGDALLGDEGGDGRKWSTLPILYFGDVFYLDEGVHDLTIKYYKEDEMKAERKTTIQRHGNGVHELRF